jgi:hypothetical protein
MITIDNPTFKDVNRFQHLFVNVMVKYHNFDKGTNSHLPFQITLLQKTEYLEHNETKRH